MTEQVRGVRSKRLARPQVGGVLYSAPLTQSISGVLALSASVAKLSAAGGTQVPHLLLQVAVLLPTARRGCPNLAEYFWLFLLFTIA